MGHDRPICWRLYNQYHLHLLPSTIPSCYLTHILLNYARKKSKLAMFPILEWMCLMIIEVLIHACRSPKTIIAATCQRLQKHHGEGFAINSFQSVSSEQKHVIGTWSLWRATDIATVMTHQWVCGLPFKFVILNVAILFFWSQK